MIIEENLEMVLVGKKKLFKSQLKLLGEKVPFNFKQGSQIFYN